MNAVDAVAWDEFVRRHDGGFFHCHAYAVYEAANAHAEPLFIRVRDAAGQCVAIAVGCVSTPRVWPFSKLSRIATFGALPLTVTDSSAFRLEVLRAVERHLARAGVFRVNVAAFDSRDSGDVLAAGGYSLRERVEFYLPIDRSLDALSADLKGGRRTDIRKAEKNGVSSRVEPAPVAQAELTRLQAASMERRDLRLDLADRGRTERLRADLVASGHAILLLSERDGRAINAALFGVFGTRAYYLLSGSSPAGNAAAGPVHILWTAIQVLQARGVTLLNLGGVGLPAEKGDPNYGLYRFKRNFGAEAQTQPSGTRELSALGASAFQVLTRVKTLAG